MTDEVQWKRFSKCESSACVEWYRTPGGVVIRSSERPDEHTLLTEDELSTLVRAYKMNEI